MEGFQVVAPNSLSFLGGEGEGGSEGRWKEGGGVFLCPTETVAKSIQNEKLAKREQRCKSQRDNFGKSLETLSAVESQSWVSF